MQFASDLASDLRSEAPFHSQTDSSEARSQITSEPINGAEPVFLETTTILCSLLQKKVKVQFCHYRLPLYPVQLRAVSQVNFVAKSNKFPFPMIPCLVDESDIGLILSLGDKRSDEAVTLHFWGSDNRLQRPIQGGPDVWWNEKAP